LIDEDGGLRFGGDLLAETQIRSASSAPGPYSDTAQLTLRCEKNEVIGDAYYDPIDKKGNNPNSGEGHHDIFGTSEAEVFARVQRGGANRSQYIDSNIVEVSCF
jgi:hypothetical protein